MANDPMNTGHPMDYGMHSAHGRPGMGMSEWNPDLMMPLPPPDRSQMAYAQTPAFGGGGMGTGGHMGTHTSNTGPHQGPGGISGGARPADMAREETRRRQEHKKQLKRAANRKSAQLSRQRKKQYVEELTKEHSELKRHAEILESLAEVVFIIDVSGTIQFVSPAVRRILEYTEDSLTDSSVYDIMSPKSAEEMRQLVEQTLATFKERASTMATVEPDDEHVVLKKMSIDFVEKGGARVSCELSGAASCRTIMQDGEAAAAAAGAAEASAAAGGCPSPVAAGAEAADELAAGVPTGEPEKHLHFVCSVRSRADLLRDEPRSKPPSTSSISSSGSSGSGLSSASTASASTTGSTSSMDASGHSSSGSGDDGPGAGGAGSDNGDSPKSGDAAHAAAALASAGAEAAAAGSVVPSADSL